MLQVDVPATSGAAVNISISVLNKTTTRLPEAMFLTFNPPEVTDAVLDKLGEPVNTNDIISGGSQKLHFVYNGFSFEVCTS